MPGGPSPRLGVRGRAGRGAATWATSSSLRRTAGDGGRPRPGGDRGASGRIARRPARGGPDRRRAPPGGPRAAGPVAAAERRRHRRGRGRGRCGRRRPPRHQGRHPGIRRGKRRRLRGRHRARARTGARRPRRGAGPPPWPISRARVLRWRGGARRPFLRRGRDPRQPPVRRAGRSGRRAGSAAARRAECDVPPRHGRRLRSACPPGGQLGPPPLRAPCAEAGVRRRDGRDRRRPHPLHRGGCARRRRDRFQLRPRGGPGSLVAYARGQPRQGLPRRACAQAGNAVLGALLSGSG